MGVRWADLPLVLEVTEVAAVLRTGRTATYDLIARGDLRAVKAGRKLRVPRGALLEFLGEQLEYESSENGTARGGNPGPCDDSSMWAKGEVGSGGG